MGTRDRGPGAPAWPDSSSARDEVHKSALYIVPNVPRMARIAPIAGPSVDYITVYHKSANADHRTRLQDDGRCSRYQSRRRARPGADLFRTAGKRRCGIYTKYVHRCTFGTFPGTSSRDGPP